MNRFLILLFFILKTSLTFAQPSSIKTIELEFPIQKIIHYPNCGDNPLYLCNKVTGSSHPEYILVNKDCQLQFEKDEVLLFADSKLVLTSNYAGEKIVLKKYELIDKQYKVNKRVELEKSLNGVRYNLQTHLIKEKLHYVSYQPYSTVEPTKSILKFYDHNLDLAFSVEEVLSSYNIHCFSHDSILILKEYINDLKLTSHLYDHTGNLLANENFKLQFKPEAHAPVFEYLEDDGIIFVVEQHEPQKTHIMKYSHKGELLWDESLDDFFYNVEEYNNYLVAYGGGNKTPHRLIFIDESTGKLKEELNLMNVYQSFTDSHHLDNTKTTFFPLGLVSNPEKTWLSLMLNVYSRDHKSQHWDRIIIYHSHSNIDYIDLDLISMDMPKIMPTEDNHLIVAVGKKVVIYKVK